MKTCFVRWKDAAYFDGSYRANSSALTPMVLETCGWLVKEDITYLVVALEHCEEAFRYITVIPRENIISVEIKEEG